MNSKINCVIIGDTENHFPFLNRINFEMKGNEMVPFPTRVTATEMLVCVTFVSVRTELIGLIFCSPCLTPTSNLFLFLFGDYFSFYVLHSYFLTVEHCIRVFLIYRSYLFYYFCRKLLILIVFLYFKASSFVFPKCSYCCPKVWMTVEEKVL